MDSKPGLTVLGATKSCDMEFSHNDNFSDSDDEDCNIDASSKTPLWCLSRDKSLSDWTIEIVNDNDEEKITVYHVHRCFLGAGNRKCKYFARLFQSDHFSECENRTSRIHLPTLAADSFPALLDFLYSDSKQLAISTESSAALYFLGQYFGCWQVRLRAKQFLQNDISLSNLQIYYEHADFFHIEKLQDIIKLFCVKEFMYLNELSPIFRSCKPDFLKDVLKQVVIDEATSRHASRLVRSYCLLQKDSICPTDFHELTDVKLLPTIHDGVASDLLDLHAFYCSRSCNDKSANETKLSSLQMRCVKTLAHKWNGLKTSDNSTLDFIDNQPQIVLATLLKQILQQADKASHRGIQCPDAGPDYIEVTNAGATNVNGSYCHEEHSAGEECRFVKNSGTFKCYIVCYPTSEYWYICQEPTDADKKPGTSSCDDFYASTKRFSKRPPQEGWRACSLGCQPLPMLHLLYE